MTESIPWLTRLAVCLRKFDLLPLFTFVPASALDTNQHLLMLTQLPRMSLLVTYPLPLSQYASILEFWLRVEVLKSFFTSPDLSHVHVSL